MNVLGVVLLLAGATGAALAAPRLRAHGHGRLVPLVVAPFGALIGAGAALLRDWNVAGTTVAASIAVPLLTVASRIVEARRGRARSPGPGS